MNKYVVYYSARKKGAIGAMSKHQETVKATSEERAKEIVRDQAYNRELEHVLITDCRFITC